jgi:hypothetical protein
MKSDVIVIIGAGGIELVIARRRCYRDFQHGGTFARAVAARTRECAAFSEYWPLPSDSATGHLYETKDDRQVLSKWGNDLRQTYGKLAQVAEISELDIHLLMSHSLRGVNAGYITRDKLLRGHLRKQKERISRIIIQHCSTTI